MRSSTSAVLFVVASAATSQELAPGARDLVHLRAAVHAWATASATFVVAVVEGGEPVILCRGTDTDGGAVEPLTYTPVGSLARLLIADAFQVKLDGKLDVPAGVTVGREQPTILALLQGTDALPDYKDWRADASALTVDDVLACAEVAAAAGFRFDQCRAGMADLMLLEQRFLEAGRDDWRSFLRVVLAPRVSGLDPLDAARLADEPRDHISLASTIAQRAQPAALRLLLTGKELANWWQWRIRTAVPLWTGSRMGYRGTVPRRGETELWKFDDFGTGPVKCLAASYPQHRSGVLCVAVGPAKWVPGLGDALTDAFEADLFGELGPAQRFGGRARGGAQTPLSGWKGKRWANGNDALPHCEVRIERATHDGLRLVFGSETGTSSQVLPHGESLRVVIGFGPDHGGVLWLCPQPSRDEPKRLIAVFVERDELSLVPHRLDLALDPGTAR